ncbi:hypothetical protein FSP39_010839 [Pinctada imbricata]|uniref:Copper acquisition factor BIM1-like domain-containing protein n=1 Tax=Pinctada imbricata TaxID=66713 RepID=A0AA88XR34_PINIB|nr:hypothetical protein FSP39_010839 [Pinctada imbricata]
MIPFLVFASVLAVAHGHLCLLNPAQRSNITGLNKAGADACFLTTGPCGGKEPRHDEVTFHREENMTVIFMKNLDHHNATSPGKFTISLGERNQEPKMLKTIPDGGEPSLTIYSVSIPVPNLQPPPRPGTLYYLQVVYEPNNSQAPKAFYQCADVSFQERGPPGRR